MGILNDEGRQEFIVTLRRDNSDTTESNSQEGNSVREDPKSVRVALISNSQLEKSNSQNIKSNSLSNSQQSESNSQELSTKEREVIAFCSVPRTSREILEHLNIGYQTKNIKRYITDLVNRGLLIMSNPSNPKDKKQKYRKV